MKIRREVRSLIIFSLSVLFASACLKDDTEEYQTAHDTAFNMLKVHYGFTENDNIGDNIYVHFTDIPDTLIQSTVYADGSDYIVVDYVGINSNLEIFDLTVQEIAEDNGISRNDIVYGPVRLKIDQAFLGFYKAIQRIPEQGSATILVPHDQAFLDYEPLVYEITNYRVFNDLDEYNSWQFQSYMDSLGMSADSSLEDAADVYYVTLNSGDSIPNLETGDTVTISLYGYYVETDTAYVEGFPGRQFFPINESGDTIKFALGDVSFPVSPIINTVLLEMKLGETREILSPAEYAYDTEGFVHPYVGVYIVPPSMPLHYTVSLIDYEKITY